MSIRLDIRLVLKEEDSPGGSRHGRGGSRGWLAGYPAPASMAGVNPDLKDSVGECEFPNGVLKGRACANPVKILPAFLGSGAATLRGR